MKIAIIGQQDFGKAVLDAFLARGDAAPPESLLNFPRCDERGFVYVVGKLMRRMVHGPVAEPISTIIDRSTAEPGLRFATLEKLVEQLRHVGASPRPRAHLRNPRRHWTHGPLVRFGSRYHPAEKGGTGGPGIARKPHASNSREHTRCVVRLAGA